MIYRAHLIPLLLADFHYVLTDNAGLNETWMQYQSPIVSYSTIDSDGYGVCSRAIQMVLCLYYHRIKRQRNPPAANG